MLNTSVAPSAKSAAHWGSILERLSSLITIGVCSMIVISRDLIVLVEHVEETIRLSVTCA